MTTVEDLRRENRELREIIRTLLTEPRRSVKLISRKFSDLEPITATFTKGQVLAAIKATSEEDQR